MTYHFGPFAVDPGAYRLTRDGAVLPLSPKIVDLLLYLVARPSTLVSKDELFRALWPDVAVTDNALTLQYDLTAPAGNTGNGAVQTTAITGNMAGGQAGNCPGGVCVNTAATNKTYTLIVTY